MKLIRILLTLFIGIIAITSSGMIDISPIVELPAFLQNPENLSLGMAIVVSDVVTEYGAYYEKSGQNKSRILQLLFQGTVTEKEMTKMKTDQTIFKLANGVIDDLVQPFQTAFTAKGTLTFKPNPIELNHIKVDFSMFPDDIEAMWMGFLASNDLKRTEWPFVRFAIEKYLIPKILDNLELKEVYKGVYAAPTPGTPGATGTSMDGLQKKLQVGIDAGTINSVILGTLTASNIFDKVEEFTDAISTRYQTVKMPVCMDPVLVKWFYRDKRSKGFYQITSDKSIDDSIDFSPQYVVPLPSMHGTAEMFATPKANMLYLTKKDQNKSKFEVQGFERLVKLLTDWYEGVGFGINEVVWSNILVTP